jgi:alpha-mannosidase
MAPDYSDYTMYLVGHAHIDLGYRWRWNETVHRIARDTFRGVLRMMDEVPDFTFVQSQLVLYEAMKQHYPEMFREIKRQIAGGRWVVADGWCEYDHTMPCGEAMIRQHLIGSRYAREELGCEITVAWAADAFSGHVHTLPTILQGCGIDHLLFGRGMPENTPFFWWEGPDGSRVLAYTPAFAYSSVIGSHLVEQLLQWEEMSGAKEMMVLYGRGDHGGGPREGDLETLAEMRAEEGNPRMIHVVPQFFFGEVLAKRAGVPTYQGELGGGFTGSLSSEGRAKQRNREAENLLLTAERFATMATYFQRKPVYPRVDFREAWKKTLHHQFHDEIPGTSRAPVYVDNAVDYDWVVAEMEMALDSALAEIGARLDTRGPGTPVVVFNPLSWERSEPAQVSLRLLTQPQHLVICDSAGNPMPTQMLSASPEGHFWQTEVAFQAQGVPPLGYKLFRAFATDAVPEVTTDLISSDTALENGFFRVEIDPESGQLLRIYDKKNDREVLNAPGNVLQAFAEEPGASSAWIIALTDQIDELAQPDSIQLIDQGPLRATVRVNYRYRDSYFVQDITLYSDFPRLDFRLHADWYERDCCLKLAFPLAVTDGQATFEAPFGYIVRPADGAEVPAQRWIDLSDAEYGTSLLNDCRYAFDIRDNLMRMTLLRGIPDLDPRADEGAHDLHYALYPHKGDWRSGNTVRRGWELNFPLITRQELHRAGMIRPWTSSAIYHSMPPEFGFLNLQPDNIVLTALKVDENEWGQRSPIILRIYETEGRATDAMLTLAAPIRLCEETNHLEEAIESQAFECEGDTMHIRFRAHEIKTFRLVLPIMSFALYEGEHRDDAVSGRPPGFEGG